MKLWLLGLSLMTFGVVSEAQETLSYKRVQQAQQRPVAQGITRDQQAALDKQDQDISQVALGIVRLIDQGKSGEVWDTASPVAQKIISRDDFQRKIAHDRGALGTLGIRMPMGLKHLRYDGTGTMPAGAFINVSFETSYEKAPQSLRENVTFILDGDNIWRFVGYAIR